MSERDNTITLLEIDVGGQIRDCVVLMRIQQTDGLKGANVEFVVMMERPGWFVVSGVTNLETGVVYDDF